jgi:hypothetical protein
VIRVTERHVALRDPEAIANLVELGARLAEQLPALLERAGRLLDDGEQDEALRAPQPAPARAQRCTACRSVSRARAWSPSK